MGRPGKELTPYESVRQFVGWLTRQTREKHHLDTEALGRITGYAENTVTAFERGDRKPSAAFLAACDAQFGTDGLFAALGPLMDLDQPAETGGKTPAPTRGPQQRTDIPQATGDSHESPGGLARLESVTLDPLQETIVLWINVEGGMVPVQLTRRELMAFGVDVGITGLAMTKEHAATSRLVVDPNLAARYKAARQTLVATDNLLGPGSVLAVVSTQIRTIARYRQAARGDVRTELLVTEALWTEFFGWLADDSGRPDLGDRSTSTALTMGIEAADPTLEAYILMRQAQRSVTGSDPQTTIGLAAAGQRHRGLPPRVRAAAAQQQACGHAMDGDERQALAKLDEARQLVADDPGSDERHPDLAVWCTPAYVLAQEGRCWLLLDKPKRAVAAFTTAIHQLGSLYHRDAGLYAALLARAHAATGELQQAARTGLSALTVGTGTSSARIIEELGALDQRLETAKAPLADAVRDFRTTYAEATRGNSGPTV